VLLLFLLTAQLLHLSHRASSLASDLEKVHRATLLSRDSRRRLDHSENVWVHRNIHAVVVCDHAVPIIALSLDPVAELIFRYDRVTHVDDPLKRMRSGQLGSITYLSREAWQVSLLREVVTHVGELEAESHHVLDRERFVVRNVQMLDLVKFQGFALATEEVLHEEDRDCSIVGQVELAVHSEQTKEMSHKAAHLLKDLFLALVLGAEHRTSDGSPFSGELHVGLHQAN
jgi:hypothetical protein